MTQIVNTYNGILHLANKVRTGWVRDDYVVRLPYTLDYTEKLYTEWLIDHPHPRVKLEFTREDLWAR